MKHTDKMTKKEFELFLYDDFKVTSLSNNYKEVRIQRYEPSLWNRIVMSLDYIFYGRIYMIYRAPEVIINSKVTNAQN